MFGFGKKKPVQTDYETKIKKIKRDKAKFLIDLKKEIILREEKGAPLDLKYEGTYKVSDFSNSLIKRLKSIVALYEHQKELLKTVKALCGNFGESKSELDELGLDENSKNIILNNANKLREFYAKKKIGGTYLDEFLDVTDNTLTYLKNKIQYRSYPDQSMHLKELSEYLLQSARMEEEFVTKKIKPLVKEYTPLHNAFFESLKSTGALEKFNEYYKNSKEEIKKIIEGKNYTIRLCFGILVASVLLAGSELFFGTSGLTFVAFSVGVISMVYGAVNSSLSNRLEKTLKVLQLSN